MGKLQCEFGRKSALARLTIEQFGGPCHSFENRVAVRTDRKSVV